MQVCRFFRELVSGSAALKYQVAIAAAGLSDGPPSNITPSERLELLQRHQDAWRKLEWSYHEAAEMHTGGLWELYGNVWVQSKGQARRHLFFHQLPSRLRGIEERKWELRLDFSMRDFGIDPSQDLLVLLEARPSYVFSFLTFGYDWLVVDFGCRGPLGMGLYAMFTFGRCPPGRITPWRRSHKCRILSS